MITIDELWNSSDSGAWANALRRYWEFVKLSNIELERDMDALDLDYLRQLDAQGWYDFLRDRYFRWKYTAHNRYATTTRNLRRYLEDRALGELHSIKLQLLSLNFSDIGCGLRMAQAIRGLGTAGASGLLALMYPQVFGTVDQFVVKALRDIRDLPEADVLARMDEGSLTTADGVTLIQIMQRKAAEINRLFGTREWTPRKIDKILWTYGRQDDSPRISGGACHEDHLYLKRRKMPSPHNQKKGAPMTNHEMIATAVKGYRGKTLSTSEIKRIVHGAFPQFSNGSLLPNDHALGNESPCRCAGTENRIFDRIKRGTYLVL